MFIRATPGSTERPTGARHAFNQHQPTPNQQTISQPAPNRPQLAPKQSTSVLPAAGQQPTGSRLAADQQPTTPNR
eukprot:8827441-Lingulodinium_polyedra.AAC.1